MKKPVAATFCPETRLLSMTFSAQSSLSHQDNQNREHGERTMTKITIHRSYAESGLRANQKSMVQEVHGSNISQMGCFWGESGLGDLTYLLPTAVRFVVEWWQRCTITLVNSSPCGQLHLHIYTSACLLSFCKLLGKKAKSGSAG